MPINRALLYAEVRARLKQRRQALNRTQAQVAADARLRRTSVANIECGHQNPPLHVLYDLCEALEVDVGALLPAASHVGALDGAAGEIPAALDLTGRPGPDGSPE